MPRSMPTGAWFSRWIERLFSGADLDTNAYPTKVKVSDEDLAAVDLQSDEFHGK